MNVMLLTTLESDEMLRLSAEARKMGHKCSLVYLRDLSFSIKNSQLNVKKLPRKNPDVVVVKGINRNQTAIVALIKNYRRIGVKVFDNGYSNHKYTINKVTDLMRLSFDGLPIPDTQHTYDYKNFVPIAEKMGFPVIIKLVGAGKGAGVFKADNKTQVKNIISRTKNEMLKDANRFILQQFIPYEHDLRVLIIGDKTYVMKRIPPENDFRANFSIGGTVEVFDLDKKGNDLAKKGLKAIGMSVGGVDLLITPEDKRYVLEVNHTPGFIGMEKATGKNIARAYIKHALSKAY